MHFTYLVLNGLTQINLFTLSTIPATDAINLSPSAYVPWPLQQREITSLFQKQKEKNQGMWVVCRASQGTKNQVITLINQNKGNRAIYIWILIALCLLYFTFRSEWSRRLVPLSLACRAGITWAWSARYFLREKWLPSLILMTVEGWGEKENCIKGWVTVKNKVRGWGGGSLFLSLPTPSNHQWLWTQIKHGSLNKQLCAS